MLVPRWLGWFGLAASLVYLLNQGDILAKRRTDVPVVGPLGSTGWAGWIVALDVSLLRALAAGQRRAPTAEHPATMRA